ncbi:MAG: cytochrome c family protein [Alphaproteobacteria bacterium]|nr:cytochrome c family protein [Alphaproteobacteria bacterium]
MDDRSNTIAGWVLGAGIVALGASIVTGEWFHAERPEKMGYPIEGVEVESKGGAAAEQPIAFYLAAADPAQGEQVFKKCATCHNATKGGANQLGPNLWGAIGKPHGHVPGFAYSDALKSKPGVWDWESLSAWLKSPKAYAPGTKMTFAGLSKPEDRANVIAYLNKQSDSPLPLPTAPATPAAAAAEASDAPAAAEKAENEPILNEAQAARTKVGGEGAPTVAGRAEQTKIK